MNEEISRTRAIASVEASIDASIRLREGLIAGEEIGRAMIENLKNGVAISESVNASGALPSDLRSTTNELLEEFEKCRHKMRLAFVLPSLGEGMTIGGIGRALGVSRQRAARLVHEASEESDERSASPEGDPRVTGEHDAS